MAPINLQAAELAAAWNRAHGYPVNGYGVKGVTNKIHQAILAVLPVVNDDDATLDDDQVYNEVEKVALTKGALTREVYPLAPFSTDPQWKEKADEVELKAYGLLGTKLWSNLSLRPDGKIQRIVLATTPYVLCRAQITTNDQGKANAVFLSEHKRLVKAYYWEPRVDANARENDNFERDALAIGKQVPDLLDDIKNDLEARGIAAQGAADTFLKGITAGEDDETPAN